MTLEREMTFHDCPSCGHVVPDEHLKCPWCEFNEAEELIGDDTAHLMDELQSIAHRGEALMANDLIAQCRFKMGVELLIKKLAVWQAAQ